MNSALHLLDVLVRRWSPHQARTLAGTLLGKTQMEISGETGVTQSTINKSLQTAFWPDIEPILEEFETLSLMGKT